MKIRNNVSGNLFYDKLSANVFKFNKFQQFLITQSHKINFTLASFFENIFALKYNTYFTDFYPLLSCSTEDILQ